MKLHGMQGMSTVQAMLFNTFALRGSFAPPFCRESPRDSSPKESIGTILGETLNMCLLVSSFSSLSMDRMSFYEKMKTEGLNASSVKTFTSQRTFLVADWAMAAPEFSSPTFVNPVPFETEGFYTSNWF